MSPSSNAKDERLIKFERCHLRSALVVRPVQEDLHLLLAWEVLEAVEVPQAQVAPVEAQVVVVAVELAQFLPRPVQLLPGTTALTAHTRRPR